MDHKILLKIPFVKIRSNWFPAPCFPSRGAAHKTLSQDIAAAQSRCFSIGPVYCASLIVLQEELSTLCMLTIETALTDSMAVPSDVIASRSLQAIPAGKPTETQSIVRIAIFLQASSTGPVQANSKLFRVAHRLLTCSMAVLLPNPKTRARRWKCLVFSSLLVSCLLYIGLVFAWTIRERPQWTHNNFSTRLGYHGNHSNREMTDQNIQDNLRMGFDVVSALHITNASSARMTSQAPLKTNTSIHIVVDLPSGENVITRQYKCVGWRSTDKCSPEGPRNPQNDQNCSARIPHGSSGYCEVEDMDSHEVFRVMKRTCAKAKATAVFKCDDAPGFSNFRAQAQKAVERTAAPGFALPNVAKTISSDRKPQRGIAMVVYPKLMASAYATIRTLREELSCRLPIEIWYRPDEWSKAPKALDPLRNLSLNDTKGGMNFRVIDNPNAVRFGAKIHAIYESVFDHVLFLDADNVPVKDPSFLFDIPEFIKTGAVFWPDYWHPGSTMFFLDKRSPVWELLDMPFVDMFEQESGQILIDRRRHAAPLELVTFYAWHRPNYFDRLSLVWGDKDLFRFAWLKLGAPFHMIATPPSIAGKRIGDMFCGMTMVQHDTDGQVLFIHRNQHKLTGVPRQKSRSSSSYESQQDRYPDPAIWTHLVMFRNTSARINYVIQRHSLPDKQRCYGRRELNSSPHFYAQEIGQLSFAGLENRLRRYALEAVQQQETRAK